MVVHSSVDGSRKSLRSTGALLSGVNRGSLACEGNLLETRYMLPGVSTYRNNWVCCCCHDRRFHQVWRTTLLCSSCGFEKSPAVVVWFQNRRLCFRIVSIASGDPQKGCFSFPPRSWRKSKTCLVCDAELPGRAAVAEVGPAACGCGFVPRKSSP